MPVLQYRAITVTAGSLGHVPPPAQCPAKLFCPLGRDEMEALPLHSPRVEGSPEESRGPVAVPAKVRYMYRYGHAFVSAAVYTRLSEEEKAKCIQLSSEDVEGYDLRGWTRDQIAKLPRDGRGRLPLSHALFGRGRQDDMGASGCQGLGQALMQLVTGDSELDRYQYERDCRLD